MSCNKQEVVWMLTYAFASSELEGSRETRGGSILFLFFTFPAILGRVVFQGVIH